MGALGVRVLTHLSPAQDPRRTPARSKGKVERAFRTVKEAHETLYHFHEPKDEAEANLWLRRFLITYNNQKHPKHLVRTVASWRVNGPYQEHHGQGVLVITPTVDAR
jgi:hypothetical protein